MMAILEKLELTKMDPNLEKIALNLSRNPRASDINGSSI